MHTFQSAQCHRSATHPYAFKVLPAGPCTHDALTYALSVEVPFHLLCSMWFFMITFCDKHSVMTSLYCDTHHHISNLSSRGVPAVSMGTRRAAVLPPSNTLRPRTQSCLSVAAAVYDAGAAGFVKFASTRRVLFCVVNFVRSIHFFSIFPYMWNTAIFKFTIFSQCFCFC